MLKNYIYWCKYSCIDLEIFLMTSSILFISTKEKMNDYEIHTQVKKKKKKNIFYSFDNPTKRLTWF